MEELQKEISTLISEKERVDDLNLLDRLVKERDGSLNRLKSIEEQINELVTKLKDK